MPEFREDFPQTTSPLTDKPTHFQNSDGDNPWLGVFRHERDGFGDFYVAPFLAGRIIRTNAYQNIEQTFSISVTQSAYSLIRSYLWRGLHMDMKPLLVTTADELDSLVSRWENVGSLRRYRIKTFEEFIQESKSLTFSTKALYSLENIKNLWLPAPDIVGRSQAVRTERLDEIRMIGEESLSDGIMYGCDGKEASLIFEYLIVEQLIVLKDGGVRPTARGLLELDKLANAQNKTVRQGFLVRRYDDEHDKFLRPVMLEVASSLNCPIEAVWENEHNDRIDERIFRLIRESLVVVVDMSTDVGQSPDRVNVGLELGYALALNKPVVVIRKKPKDDLSKEEEWKKLLPFDIITTNCYDFEKSKEGREALVQKLVARVGIALDLQQSS